MSVDYSGALEAIPTFEDGKPLQVQIDAKYASLHGRTPVRFPVSMWAEGAPAGTWYFDDDGIAFGGMSPEGYNGRYTLRNV